MGVLSGSREPGSNVTRATSRRPESEDEYAALYDLVAKHVDRQIRLAVAREQVAGIKTIPKARAS